MRLTKTKLALAGAAFLGAAGTGGYLLEDYTYSDGTRTGVVTKLSNKGVFFKTYEGQLAMQNFAQGGSRSDTGANSTVSNTFNFSVVDPAIVDEINQAIDAGDYVKLTYEQKLFPWFLERKTEYEITAVDVVEAPRTIAPAVRP
jgi:hypothetical protein